MRRVRFTIHYSLLIILLLLLIGCRDSEGRATAVVTTPDPNATPTLNVTQEAIAAMLTYQAANPRPTRTPNGFTNITQTEAARQAATRDMETRQAETTATPSTLTPTPTPTNTPIPRDTMLTIPYGNAPVLDGTIADGEWEGGTTVTIQPVEGTAVAIQLMHDGNNLYLAYSGLDQPIAYAPEVWLDPDNSSGNVLTDADLWFHVSTAVTCQGRATNIFEYCGAPQSWQTTIPRDNADIVEMAIPLSHNNPMGMLLSLMSITYSGDARDSWPATAVAPTPATWAQINFATP